MSEHRVNPELLHRTAWGHPVWNALQSLNIYAFCLVASLATCITGMSVVHTDNDAGI